MATQVNGEVQPASATLSHITGYPVVNDSIAYIRQNRYGQLSIEFGDSAYQKIAKPVLPYLARPYEYVSPYVRKADQLGEQTLTRVDERVPALKKPTGKLWTDGKDIFFFPYRKGVETKEHVFGLYNSEYKKIGGDGIVTSGKAALSTGLVVTVETLNWISDILRAGKAQAKSAGNDLAHHVNPN